jgi:transposase
MIQIFLTEEEQKVLKRMMRQETGRVSMRAHMVLLNGVHKLSAPKIALLFDMDSDAIRLWLNRYKEQGIRGLYDIQKSGRPKALNEEEEQALEKIVIENKLPQQTCANFWTVSLLLMWLKVTYQKIVNQATIRRTLHSLDFSWKRPCLWPSFPDPLGSLKMLEISRVFYSLTESDVFLCLDETTFRLLPLIRSCWQKVKEQLRIPIQFCWNSSFTVFGAINILTGQWFYKITQKHKSKDFLSFLKLLLEKNTKVKIFIALDKAPWHTSQEVENFLKDNSRIVLLWFPKGSPQLNPVEKIWRKLKDKTASNRWFGYIKLLKERVIAFFESKSNQELLVMAGLAS